MKSIGMKIAGQRSEQIREAARSVWRLARRERFAHGHETPSRVEFERDFIRLRAYPEGKDLSSEGPVLLLIPPLLLSWQVYDISPELSAVGHLVRAGVRVWLVDFGRPEAHPEGLDKKQDDYFQLLDEAISYVAEVSGQAIHLGGYSQGGVLAYVAAARRQCRSIASLITFGSPVDMYQNVPGALNRSLVDEVVRDWRPFLNKMIQPVQRFPGWLASVGFKALSPRQEMRYWRLILSRLADPEALAALEPTRRFLGGEGFRSLPGPLMRDFVDQLVLQNRLVRGGIVIGGKTLTLSDLRLPILYFVASRDGIAQEQSVRALSKVAVEAEIYESGVESGHFGLVVGRRALREVWPKVAQWLCWQEEGTRTGGGMGARPQGLVRCGQRASEVGDVPEEPLAPDTNKESLSLLLDSFWDELGERSLEVGRTASGFWKMMRYQGPHVVRALRARGNLRISMSLVLRQKALKSPEAPFFLWEGRAYSFQEADARVSDVARGLLRRGVMKGHSVAILMDNSPGYLCALVALNRIGAVAVLLNTGMRGEALRQGLNSAQCRWGIANGKYVALLAEELGEQRVLLLQAQRPSEGGTGKGEESLAKSRLGLESSEGSRTSEVPFGEHWDQGRADDLALLMFTSGTTGLPKAAKISNRRWFMAAFGACLGAGLTPDDTVYMCLPLYHATGLLLGVGGAILGSCQLALAPRFSRRHFWQDVRQTGSTVVFYVGELARYLVDAPRQAIQEGHPVRAFVGNGMREDVWRRVLERFGSVRIMEFYGSTEGNVALVNLTGEKVGSVGRVPFGLVQVELVRYDCEERSYEEDEQGFKIKCGADEPGMLLSQIKGGDPFSRFDGYTDEFATNKKILRHVFRQGDAWFVTGDVLRRDGEGDYWFVDRVGDTYRWKGENVSTQQVCDVVHQADFVRFAAVYGVEVEGQEGRAGMVAIELEDDHIFDGVAFYQLMASELVKASQPRFVRIVDSMPHTESFKVMKYRLQQEALAGAAEAEIYWRNESRGRYELFGARSLEEIADSL